MKKERWIHMDEKEKKQSFDEEFAPEISPDIGKMYISHLNIKTLRF